MDFSFEQERNANLPFLDVKVSRAAFAPIYIFILYILVYILIHILGNNTFFYCVMTIYISLYFSNQIEFDLKSINREFLLFLKSLNKHYIQYFEKVFFSFLKKSVVFVSLDFNV